MKRRQIFTIYCSAALLASWGKPKVRQCWRDAVVDQGGTPVKGCSITIRRFGNRCSVSGLVDTSSKTKSY